MEVGWKALKTRRRNSFIQGPDCGGVIYPCREWARPKTGNGPLCVFSSEAAAHIFVGQPPMPEHTAKIVRCLYIPDEDYNEVWYMSYSGAKGWHNSNFSNLPHGTKLARAVCCLE